MSLYISIMPQASIPVDEQRLPSGRIFARLKHDYEIYGVSRPTHNDATRKAQGLPETIKAVLPVFVNMTKAWQLYWINLFSLSRYGQLYDDLIPSEKIVINLAFRGVTAGYRAFTNRRGWDDGYADYINNVNTNKLPMQQETINTGGNIVEILSNELRIGGKNAYKVRTLNGKNNPPDIYETNHLTEPWLVFRATVSRREEYNDNSGKWLRENVVIPFDQLQGYDVPIPFTCNDEFNYIEAERIQLLDDNSIIPSPYNR